MRERTPKSSVVIESELSLTPSCVIGIVQCQPKCVIWSYAECCPLVCHLELYSVIHSLFLILC